MDRKTPTPRTGLFRTTSIAATAFMPQFLPYGNRPNRPGGGPNRPPTVGRPPHPAAKPPPPPLPPSQNKGGMVCNFY